MTSSQTKNKMVADWYQDVLDFHLKFNCYASPIPSVPSDAGINFRRCLATEEQTELFEAMDANDLPGIADACADLIYVVIGLAVTYGIDLRPVWEAVQKANMSKVGGATREDGKILKPDGWKAPDVEGIIDEQRDVSAMMIEQKLIEWRQRRVSLQASSRYK